MKFNNIIDYEKSEDIFDFSNNNNLFYSGLQGFAVENHFIFNDVELCIDYFLGNSDNSVYDIEQYNKKYNNKPNFKVIGAFLGGDTFGVIEGSEQIYLNFDTYENFDDEIFEPIADNLEEFLKMVFNEN